MRLTHSVVATLARTLTCLTLLFQVGTNNALADNSNRDRSPAPAAQISQALQQAKQEAEAGNLQQAIALYEQLISQYPSFPELYNNAAVLLAKQGKLEMAREKLETAMRLNSVYSTLYDNLSAVYVEMARGSYAKALQLGMTPREVALKPVLIDSQEKAVAQIPSSDVNATVAEQRQSGDRQDRGLDYENIKMTLQGWASAWSAQEVDLYLSFYAPEFKPGKNLRRGDWAKQRRLRLRKPEWVKVTLDNIQIEAIENNRVSARFVQEYQSDRYNDITHKEILLQPSPEGWRILAESAL